eukprot:4895534-Pleurochrysis_carterae.AAC.3
MAVSLRGGATCMHSDAHAARAGVESCVDVCASSVRAPLSRRHVPAKRVGTFAPKELGRSCQRSWDVSCQMSWDVRAKRVRTLAPKRSRGRAPPRWMVCAACSPLPTSLPLTATTTSPRCTPLQQQRAHATAAVEGGEGTRG